MRIHYLNNARDNFVYSRFLGKLKECQKQQLSRIVLYFEKSKLRNDSCDMRNELNFLISLRSKVRDFDSIAKMQVDDIPSQREIFLENDRKLENYSGLGNLNKIITNSIFQTTCTRIC